MKCANHDAPAAIVRSAQVVQNQHSPLPLGGEGPGVRGRVMVRSPAPTRTERNVVINKRNLVPPIMPPAIGEWK